MVAQNRRSDVSKLRANLVLAASLKVDFDLGAEPMGAQQFIVKNGDLGPRNLGIDDVRRYAFACRDKQMFQRSEVLPGWGCHKRSVGFLGSPTAKCFG